MDLRGAAEGIRSLARNVEKVITGKPRAVELAVVALFSGQHLLIDDVPGVGKTMLGRSLARSIDASFKRIQGTSDLLPTDITGTTIYNQSNGTFSFSPGPVFANVVLFDEINRATPKTQSALLQVMDEGSVSADGDVHDVPRPFFVVATRNPAEHHGTFPLPEGELDRFGLCIAIGYPDPYSERRVIADQMTTHPIEDLEPVLEQDAVIACQAAVRTVHIDDTVIDYIVAIVRSTREHAEVSLGASPRGSLALTRAAQAKALFDGRDYVLPDDVKAIAASALSHRILLRSERGSVGSRASRELVETTLRTIPAPVTSQGPAAEAGG